MMRSQKSRLLSATDVDSANKPEKTLTLKSKPASEGDLIVLKNEKLKELTVDKLISKNDDENIKLQSIDNELQLNKEQVNWKAHGGRPKQRILSKEMGKNTTMDKKLYPMTGNAVTVQKKEVPKTENTIEKEQRAKNRILVDKNYNNTKLQLIKTPNGYVKKITYYETRHFIKPKNWPTGTYQQRQCLGFPLILLANDSITLPLPSKKWSSKVTLYKVLPSVFKRHILTMFTGDLNKHQIPEQDRQKYQPSSVIFRRARTTSPQLTAAQHCVTYDRIVIFRPRSYSVHFDGYRVELNGAPDALTCVQDVIRLLDIIDSISMSNPMVEIFTTN